MTSVGIRLNFLFFLFSFLLVNAQKSFSLPQAIEEGLKNNIELKNAKLDIEYAKAVNKEILGKGLPQLSANGNFVYNYNLPTSLIPESAFNPMAPKDKLQPVVFAQSYIFLGQLQATQVLFEPSLFVAYKARKVLVELSTISASRTELDVKEAITKAYYTVLVNKKRIDLLESNLTVLKKTKFTVEQLYKNGFSEKLDVDRLTVSLNGLESEKIKVTQLLQLTENLLKFQIGIDLNESIELTDKLDEKEIQKIASLLADEILAENSIEYQLSISNLKRKQFELQNQQLSKLPTIAAFWNYGYNGPTNNFNNVTFYSQGSEGINISIPLFSGFSKNAKIRQAKIELEKSKNNLDLLKKQYEIKGKSLSVNLRNAILTYNLEKQNMTLAEKVFKQTQKKYEVGTGTNLEIVQSQKDFVQAQTNFYNSLYEIIINKTEYLKALNKL